MLQQPQCTKWPCKVYKSIDVVAHSSQVVKLEVCQQLEVWLSPQTSTLTSVGMKGVAHLALGEVLLLLTKNCIFLCSFANDFLCVLARNGQTFIYANHLLEKYGAVCLTSYSPALKSHCQAEFPSAATWQWQPSPQSYLHCCLFKISVPTSY